MDETCDGCGAAGETLTAFRRYDLVRARRAEARASSGGAGRIEITRHSPRYENHVVELALCPACHAAAVAEEEAEGRSTRRATLVLATIAVVVGLVSLFGPPYWPVIAGWFHVKSEMDAAAERSAQTPMSPYKPPDLAPPSNPSNPPPTTP